MRITSAALTSAYRARARASSSAASTQTVRLVQVRPTLSRRVYALWRANDSRRPTVKALLDALEAAAREVRPRARSRKLQAESSN